MIFRPAATLALLLSAAPVAAQDDITPASVRAHERFLTSAALRGRGSATADEAVAAAYVAAQFEAAGLKPAPGMPGYIQTAAVVRPRATDPAALTVGGTAVAGARVVRFDGGTVGGPLVIVRRAKGTVPRGATILYTGPSKGSRDIAGAATKAGAALLLLVAEPDKERDPPRLQDYLADARPAPRVPIALVPAAAVKAMKTGAPVSLTLAIVRDAAVTTNAIGYLPGTDPAARLLLVTAHLDHLGIVDGIVREGANDNASGTVAVIELARTLAAGTPMKRGILFVAYGAEEAGLLGSRWFGMHPPVPLDRIAANIEFEMIGAQDPKLPRGALMMTGMDRSDLGAILAAHGARVAADPYPTQHFFERSDNYSLATRGIVAHTLSGWATVPTYHQATDNFASIDLEFMTAAIRSLVAPIRAIADGAAEPRWKPGGRPTE